MRHLGCRCPAWNRIHRIGHGQDQLADRAARTTAGKSTRFSDRQRRTPTTSALPERSFTLRPKLSRSFETTRAPSRPPGLSVEPGSSINTSGRCRGSLMISHAGFLFDELGQRARLKAARARLSHRRAEVDPSTKGIHCRTVSAPRRRRPRPSHSPTLYERRLVRPRGPQIAGCERGRRLRCPALPSCWRGYCRTRRWRGCLCLTPAV
jgi:hypothetical protein